PTTVVENGPVLEGAPRYTRLRNAINQSLKHPLASLNQPEESADHRVAVAPPPVSLQRPQTLAASRGVAGATPSIVWTKQPTNASYPGVTGFTSLHFDPMTR